jgi:cytochrome c oxidase subunit 2
MRLLASMLLQGLPFQPDQASTVAPSVDHLFFFITAVTLFFSILIFSIIFYFMIKYRRRSPDERPEAIEGSLPLEILWTAIPTVIVAVMFVWSSSLYFRNSEAPPGSMEIFVTGKQWMWKAEHPEGQREINELHVPLGRPVKLTMTSEDVIHDFFVPAFRVKKDVLPGRYTSLWFEATQLGTFHLFCAQYCGAFHAGMVGSVIVMQPDEYEDWLAGGGQGAQGAQGESMDVAGGRLFEQTGCATCHLQDGTGQGPSLLGVYGHPVHLSNGQTVTADDAYVRESIVNPNAKIVNGYKPVMPSFQGQLGEEQILDLLAYLQSLGKEQGKQPEEGKK